MGVAVSEDGSRIYVAESAGERTVACFDAGGTEIGALRPPRRTGADNVPVYIAIDPLDREVYVSDRLAGTIYIYDAAGTFQRDVRPGRRRAGWQPLGMRSTQTAPST